MSTSIRDGSVKREGNCSLRCTGGIAVFDEQYSYIVESTSKTESYDVVITTTGLPLPGVTASPSGFGLCRATNATRWETNPYFWTVVADFSSEVDEKQNNQDPRTDPETWVPIFETKFERKQEIVTRDYDDNPIANSAGQPFETGLTIARFLPIWEFFQFESASVTDEDIIDRNESINSADFKGRDPETLLLNVLSSVVGFYYGQRRRLTKYSLKYDYKTWVHRRLDVGTVYKSGSDLLPYTDKYNNVILGGLDGSGAKVTVGDGPAVLDFAMYPSIDFNDFLRV